MMTPIKYCILLLSIFVVLVGCSTATHNPTAKELLKEYPDIDILQYQDIIYSKTEMIELKAGKGNLLGEIKKCKTTGSMFKNFYASKLAKGTKIFAVGDDNTFMLIAEVDGELIYYKALLEG
ncbi:hypothetical protein MHH85_11955 [Viridibacillus sp. FSL E2-0187]|uniref:hypothetical protein n=1 Tax=Viridibacillus sp. FSL E2-0187 TaxID=2921362 RepID=UPI0030FD11FF